MPGEDARRARMAHHSSPDVIIGKKGVTEEILREIDLRLKKKKIVKVKMLKTAIEAMGGADRRILAREIAKALNAKLVGVRGRTFVLYREKD
ncbi:MAG: YhbY family RNA-binding protein [Desulfurococcales archaeon]|nr:YhbY family RNA-binding protein [Desulfurococcales archaeon]